MGACGTRIGRCWMAVVLVVAAVAAALAQAPQKKAPSGNSMDNLRQQVFALHEFHEVNGSFPAAYSVSDAGKPLLSWRVAILPLLGEKKLYAEFHLDEPWDSEHNKGLIAKMPKVFRSPTSKAEEGMTTYMGNGGPVGVISRPPARFPDIIDGTSNTFAIVEVSDKAAVVWTRPEQWMFKPGDALKEFAGEFCAALADGSVYRIPKGTAPVMLERMFNREDGELVEFPPGTKEH
jgi:Protein of unknown function (DUF1559)